MKVEVDPALCKTAGICVMQCPEVFRFTEGSKKAAVILDEIPENLQAKCLRASLMCPEKAIIVKK